MVLGFNTELQAVQFEESVASIIRRHGRYDGQAYFFLKDALDFTLKRVMDEWGVNECRDAVLAQ